MELNETFFLKKKKNDFIIKIPKMGRKARNSFFSYFLITYELQLTCKHDIKKEATFSSEHFSKN